MSKESSKSISTGTSNSTRRTSQPLDDVPKLLTNDQEESGFSGDVTNPSAVVGETETGLGAESGSDTWVHVPSAGSQTYAAFQNVMGQDTAIQGGKVLTEDRVPIVEGRTYMNGDGNLTVVSLNETEGVVPVLEAASVNGQQEMVLASNPQNVLGDPQAQGTDNDAIPNHLDAIRLESERKNAELKKVKKELAKSKLNESQLKEEVDKLMKEIEELRKQKKSLEQQLHQKEEETKKTKEEQQQHIMELEIELQKMEAKVESVRKRLAEAEKESGVEKKNLEEYIETLENERKDLKSTVTKLQVDQQNSYIESQKKIFGLKDELNKKKDEEIARIKTLCELELKYSRAETTISNQKRQIEKNEHKEQLQREKDSSQAQIQQLLNQVKKLKSFEEATNEPKSSQTSPTLVDPPPLCMDHQTSRTESSASTSSLRHSTGTQNSLTESTEAPSRSTSEQDTGITKNEANGDIPPGGAGFTISDSTFDLPKLQDTAQDKDSIQAS